MHHRWISHDVSFEEIVSIQGVQTLFTTKVEGMLLIVDQMLQFLIPTFLKKSLPFNESKLYRKRDASKVTSNRSGAAVCHDYLLEEIVAIQGIQTLDKEIE